VRRILPPTGITTTLVGLAVRVLVHEDQVVTTRSQGLKHLHRDSVDDHKTMPTKSSECKPSANQTMFAHALSYFAIVAALLSQQQFISASSISEEVLADIFDELEDENDVVHRIILEIQEKHSLRELSTTHRELAVFGVFESFWQALMNWLRILFVGNGGSGNEGNTPSTLDEGEEKTMIFMREEEKLARDVYLTFHEEYNLSVFSNIAGSEQTHMDRMLDLIDTYNLSDPVVDDSVSWGVHQR